MAPGVAGSLHTREQQLFSPFHNVYAGTTSTALPPTARPDGSSAAAPIETCSRGISRPPALPPPDLAKSVGAGRLDSVGVPPRRGSLAHAAFVTDLREVLSRLGFNKHEDLSFEQLDQGEPF